MTRTQTRVVVFDFGNVVARFSHRRAAEALASHGQDVDAAAVQAFCFGSVLDDTFERGHMDPADFRTRVRHAFGITCSDTAFDKAFADIFEPIHDVIALVRNLSAATPLALLSNTTPIHSQWFLERMAADLQPFGTLVMSHDTGHRKPEPGIFAYVERQTGHPANAHILVDDLAANVAGACAAGWDGIVFTEGMDLAGELRRLGVVVK